MVPCGSVPKAAIEIVTGPGVRSVSPPNSGQPYRFASAPRPRANSFSQCGLDGLRDRQRQQESRRLGALGGEIGEIDPQRLARDGVGGIVREEMHAADDGVGFQHQLVARRRHQHRGIVDQSERAGMRRQRLEVARDQPVLGRLLISSLAGHQRAAASNSSARSWRASWSSTALTMPVSSRSTKAWATSTYSDTTTRAGTSRLRSSS